MGEELGRVEGVVGEGIGCGVRGGKVECRVGYEGDVRGEGEVMVNEKVGKEVVSGGKWVKMESEEGEMKGVDIVGWGGVMGGEEEDVEGIGGEIVGG